MSDLNLRIRYPYQVHFVRKRHRIGELATVWAGGILVVNCVDAADAPAACRIRHTHPGHTMEFEVRHHGGSFWWPVADENGLVAASDFEHGLAQGSSHLGLLHADIGLRGSRQFADEDEFWKSVEVRQIKNTGQEKSYARAQRGASRLLFCDGVVHIRGGEPVLCATLNEEETTAQIDAVDSEPATEIGWFCPQPLGRSPSALRRCATQGLLFGIDELGLAASVLSSNDAAIVEAASVEILMPEVLRANIFDICVRAAAQSLSALLSHRAMPWTFPGTADLRSRLPILFQQEGSLQAEDIQALAAALFDFTVWCEEDRPRHENFMEAYDLAKQGVERMTRAAVQRGRTFLPLDPGDAAAMKSLGC
jgi:hypothetical protein